jgi:hypothetical protein
MRVSYFAGVPQEAEAEYAFWEYQLTDEVTIAE